VTPFADGQEPELIAQQVDAFTLPMRPSRIDNNIYYINVTGLTREAIADKSLLAPDGLHPSGKEYARWAEEIKRKITR